MTEFVGTLYTPEVREYIYSREWPKGLQVDVFEEEFNLNIIFYRDNWLTLTREAQFSAAAIVKEVMEKLRADGIPVYMGRMESRFSGE